MLGLHIRCRPVEAVIRARVACLVGIASPNRRVTRSGSSVVERIPRAIRSPPPGRPGLEQTESGMGPEDVRILALMLPEAVAGAHSGNPDFRVGGRIFATLWVEEARVVLRLVPADQAALCEA